MTTTNNNNTLRQRRGGDNRSSLTVLPWKKGGGEQVTEETPVPAAQQSSSDNNIREGLPRPASARSVAKDEGRKRKIVVRIISGALMIGIFLSCTYLGHLYVCLLVALVEMLLFRELVKVRYSAFFNTIQDTIPLFRTTQWLWFCVAIFFTYGDFVLEIIQGNQALHHLLPYAKYSTSIAFILYSGTFVITIATLQVGHIKFQLNQASWTIVVLGLTVGQLKYVMHNIFNGLFWFVLPILLVVTNDIMAYVSGMTCGRKLIRRPFLPLSPNKTWEGFLGGWIFTMVAAWYLAGFLAQFPWLTCPTNEFNLFPNHLECELDPIFQKAHSIVPSQVFELMPRPIVKLFPGIVEVCAAKGTDVLTPCISSDTSHSHDHFELVLENVVPVQIHALWLALFASLVAPFGGFLASAIKRAYGIKDFDSLIPGHGGVMDRMDCQFLMALYTWVHYNTFVRLATVSVPKLIYMFNLLSEAEKAQFLKQVTGGKRR